MHIIDEVVRYRERHSESEGESDSEDSNIVFRTLRRNEKPELKGLRCPKSYDSSISASVHVRSGTSLKRKSEWISATRSLKVASAWAAREHGAGKIARFKINHENIPIEHFDLTQKSDREKIFNSENDRGAIFAKSSQEVILRRSVPKENLDVVYKAEFISKEDYSLFKSFRKPGDSWKLLKTRSTVHETIDGEKVKTKPREILVTEIYNEKSFINQARSEWDKIPYNDKLELGYKGLSPYDIDYISNKDEYSKYMSELGESLTELYRNKAKEIWDRVPNAHKVSLQGYELDPYKNNLIKKPQDFNEYKRTLKEKLMLSLSDYMKKKNTL